MANVIELNLTTQMMSADNSSKRIFFFIADV